MSEHNGHNGATPKPVLSVEQFAAYLEQQFNLADQITVLGRAGTTLELLVREKEVTLDVAKFYSAYTSDPSQLDVIGLTFVRALLDAQPERAAQPWSALVERVYPMLKPIAILAAVRERKLPMLAYREFLADLIITYVVDEDRSVTYLNEDHLSHWEITIQDVHTQALQNLQRRSANVDYVTAGSDEQQLFIFNSNDGYDATRLLLTDVLAGWAAQVAGQLLIGIPNRDFLIAFGDADDEVVQGIAHQVQADSAQREHGLTDQLFVFENGQVREYHWD